MQSKLVYNNLPITTMQNLYLNPSVMFFNNKFSAGLAVEGVKIVSSASTENKTNVILYGDMILSNLIETYKLQPSLLLSFGSINIVGFGSNILLSNTLLLGMGIIGYLPPFNYSEIWIHGGFKFKEIFYLFLHVNDYVYFTPSLYFASPTISLSFSVNLYKNKEKVPRYF
jgi:hypothetical protein